MRLSKLASYIKEQLDRGFSLGSIRMMLLQHGHLQNDIDNAVNELYRPGEVRHLIHFSPGAMAVLIVIAVGIIASFAALYYFSQDSSPKYLLDISIKQIKTIARQGEDFPFIVKMSNEGSKNRADISMKYELISKKDYKIIKTEEETIAIETKASFDKSFHIPDYAAPGDYIMRVTGSYPDGRKAPPASMTFKVNKGLAAAEPSMNATGDNTTAANDNDTIADVPEQPHTEAPAKVTDEEPSKVIEMVGKIASENPSGAASYCVKMEMQSSKDLCYLAVGSSSGEKRFCSLITDERTSYKCFEVIARQTMQPGICAEIQRDNWRDNCYVSFITSENKDFSVCEKISNPHIMQSCEAMKVSYESLDPEQLAYYQSLFNVSLLSFVTE